MKANMKKTLVSSAVAGALMVGTVGFSTAKAELEFNVGVFSDYILYGLSESNNNAVVQGGVDWGHESGFYLGSWWSTLGDGDGQEVDLYLGYEFAAGDVDFDIGYVYYYYPGLDDADFGDIVATVGYGPVYASVNYAIHADDSDVTDSAYYAIGGEAEVMPDLSLGAELGYADPDVGDDWTFWSLGLTKSTGMGDFSLTYADTDDSDEDPLFVVGYTMSF
ncbi:MAG: hypothetical protein EA347_07285 [Thioalkalivibrio sp.]|nr:MAG: hypothetical protein EA347_07285 [Thioalkalivibrio sp.]